MKSLSFAVVFAALSVFFVFTSPVFAIDLLSPYISSSPVIDGSVTGSEWDGAEIMSIPGGYMYVGHNNSYLFILFDMTSDTTLVPPGTAEDVDYFWLTFDVDIDSAVTPNVDLNYGPKPLSGDLGVQEYNGLASWTGLGPTTSQMDVGFGNSPNAGYSHVIWELAIDLNEISSAVNRLVRTGFRIHSSSPSFIYNIPTDFYSDFSDLIEIYLLKTATVSSCPDVGIAGDFASSRGIYFLVDESFNAIDVRLAANKPGLYSFKVEIRPGNNFLAPVIAETYVTTTLSDYTLGHPYDFVRIAFGEPIIVSGPTGLNLKFTEIEAPHLGSMYMETAGISNYPCSQAYVTEKNNVNSPSLRSSAMGFKATSVECPMRIHEDLNGDCRSDLGDLAILAQKWLNCWLIVQANCL